MPEPERTAQGFPVISRAQAGQDISSTDVEVRMLLGRAYRAHETNDLAGAAEQVEHARASLDWLADRLAITEGGTLGRRIAPRTGDDTPSAAV